MPLGCNESSGLRSAVVLVSPEAGCLAAVVPVAALAALLRGVVGVLSPPLFRDCASTDDARALLVLPAMRSAICCAYVTNVYEITRCVLR